jgi:hypothetical protein
VYGEPKPIVLGIHFAGHLKLDPDDGSFVSLAVPWHEVMTSLVTADLELCEFEACPTCGSSRVCCDKHDSVRYLLDVPRAVVRPEVDESGSLSSSGSIKDGSDSSSA